ncbi:hypothetical protein Y032_0398g720 [Ancylostoma ceylanicum]|uniref:Uncharacterized protein n=1 Tax=Ancylostoma ceylanicum TaxID=53326 RepID=A0A016RR92_9BILA|nr:hypothetical protein Y032_0398g720 [Ancylostoma ceylanicum]
MAYIMSMAEFNKALDSMEQEESTSSVAVAFRTLDSRLESLMNVCFATSGRLDRIEGALNLLIERSTPKSACVFCSLAENADSHHSGRCPRFPDPVSRAVQASKLGLCERCLKPSHPNDCGIACQYCRMPHNSLLCPSRSFHYASTSKKRKQ